MIFKCCVKHNGVDYPIGADVPIGVEEKAVAEEKPVEAKRTYTKTEINRMSVNDLKKLAVEENIKDAESMTGQLLKKALINKLEL